MTYEVTGDRADHAQPARARQRHHLRAAARARRVRRARQPRSGGARDRALRQRQGLLRRLRPGRLRRARHGAGSTGGRGAGGLAARSGGRSAANHDPDALLGPDGRLPDDEPQRARLHVPVSRRQAGGLQGPRLLRRRRHRHGALLGPAGDREDAKIGYPPARVWGVPTTALWAHRIGIERAKRLLFTGDCLTGDRGGGVGAGDRGGAGRPSSTRASRRCSSGSRGCR